MSSDPEPWQAILVATLAGASTIIGGLSLFLVRRFKPVPFSICLGLAGGVMTYVTMVEMVPEAIDLSSKGIIAIQAEKTDPFPEQRSVAFGWLLGTSCVFAGWTLAWMISAGLDTCLEHMDLVGEIKFDDAGDLIAKKEGLVTMNVDAALKDVQEETDEEVDIEDVENGLLAARSNGITMVDHKMLARFYVDGVWDGERALKSLIEKEGSFTKFLFKMKKSVDESEFCQIYLANSAFKRDQSKFLRLGLFTALALGIHNVPEGMATYTSYMEDQNFGISMAFAIAVHNIPEGIAVAVPCYFGTGSWVKALSLCTISAVAEPIGACIAMGIKKASDSELTDGIMFGFIAGFMLRVALSELFFTAFRYDPTNVVANKSMCVGMGIMAFSLVLFEFVQ